MSSFHPRELIFGESERESSFGEVKDFSRTLLLPLRLNEDSNKKKKKCQDLFKETSAMFSQYNAWSHTSSFGKQVKIETTRLQNFDLFFYSFLFLSFILLSMLFLLFLQILIRYNYFCYSFHTILTFLIQCLEK